MIGGIFVYLVFCYAIKNKINEEQFIKIVHRLLVIVTVFYLFYALILSIGQYYVWSENPISKALIQEQVNIENTGIIGKFFNLIIPNSFNYYIYYVFMKFWFEYLLTIGFGFLFVYFLKFLKKHQERFFENGEIELGGLCAILSRWPKSIVFIILVFVSVVLVSIFRLLVFKDKYTTLGYPFILATFITFLIGAYILSITGLDVLKI